MRQDRTSSNSEDYIIKNNKKTKFGAGIIIAVLIILILGVVLSGLYFQWW